MKTCTHTRCVIESGQCIEDRCSSARDWNILNAHDDRTLGRALPRPFAVGIGYERVRLASIRPQPHDIPMDAIVTEAGVVFERPTPIAG